MSAEERREQILDVTAEILTAHGFNGLSIQSVAQAAGVSRPIVYEHFGDLGGLLEALVDREMKRAGEQISIRALRNLESGDPRRADSGIAGSQSDQVLDQQA